MRQTEFYARWLFLPIRCLFLCLFGGFDAQPSPTYFTRRHCLRLGSLRDTVRLSRLNDQIKMFRNRDKNNELSDFV